MTQGPRCSPFNRAGYGDGGQEQTDPSRSVEALMATPPLLSPPPQERLPHPRAEGTRDSGPSVANVS